MKGSSILFVFGFIQLLVGTRMLRRALAERARLGPWRGQAILAASSIAFGVTCMLSRGQMQPAVGVASLGCILSYVIGGVVSLREPKRLTLDRRHHRHGV